MSPMSLFIFLFLSFSFSGTMVFGDTCSYSLTVRTGDLADAGTDATIGLFLYDENENVVSIKDIVKWGGQMGPRHDYFERGQVDFFQGTANCLPGLVCAMNMTSDNSGNKPGWELDYVQVTTTKPKPNVARFEINQWLALDEYPYQLWAYKSICGEFKTTTATTIGGHDEQIIKSFVDSAV